MNAKIKLTALMLLLALFTSIQPANAQTIEFNTLASFDNTNGTAPVAALTLGPDSNLYGTTYFGGTSNFGTIFRLTPGGTLTTLLSFSNTSGPALGAYPAGALAVGLDGNFYSTTLLGGTNGAGTVFQLTTNGGFTSLASFNSLGGPRAVEAILGDTNATNTNGGEPFAALALAADGSFYGTTVYGGSNGVGTVFHVTTNGTLTSLCSFAGLASNGGTNASGAKPLNGLTFLTVGDLYGLTSYGGSDGVGTIFQMATNGALTSLYSFSKGTDNEDGVYTNADGAEPIENSLTLGLDGNFYGEASYGGITGSGTIFKLTTNGVLNPIFTFDAQIPDGKAYTNMTGASPNGLTPGPDGRFYGTTSSAGTNGVGTVFSINTNGTFKLLYSFRPLVRGTNASGAEPSQLTLGPDGNLYGTTFAGGIYGYGTVFQVILPPVLKIQYIAGSAVLTWSNTAFSLESATRLDGSYSPVLGAYSNRYTNAVTSGNQFFRLGIVKSF